MVVGAVEVAFAYTFLQLEMLSPELPAMHRVVRAALAIAATATLTVCGDSTAPVPDTTVAAVVLSPSAPATIASGSNLTFTATVSNKAGEAIAGTAVSWSSSDTQIATVSAGIVTGVKVGQAMISAASGGVSSVPVTVTVTPGVATSIAIRTQPAGSISGAALTTQPAVEIRDAAGNLVTSSTAAVTATLGGTTGGTLSGTVTVNAVAGVATFTNLTITGAGTRTLVFSAPSLTNATSADITVVAATALTIRRFAETAPNITARLVRDPISGLLYVLRLDGSVYRLVPNSNGATAEIVYTATVTGMPNPQGMAFGPEGTLYLVGDQTSADHYITATIRRGARVSQTSDTRTWSNVAHTVPYPQSYTQDHRFNGIAVTADNRFLYVNSGARTDHGELETLNGQFPGLRELPITALILRLPTDGADILLQNDDAALRAGGYVCARGVRNSFDLAFSATGELFAGENSGNRDDNDELNWIQDGHHYGFPWRMGTNDTPQQFPGYDPSADKLVNHGYTDWATLFSNDPTYPARPSTPFTDPVANVGPDANSFRDPATGIAHKASDLGRTLATFTSHRSPLGLVFDVRNELPDRFRGTAFILSFTPGTPTNDNGQGPFLDESQDLLQLVLTRSGDNFQTTATRLVCGFHLPVDSEIMNGKLYVLEYATGTVWEITLPTGSEAARVGCVNVP
jgi:hypothetical protein